MTTDDAPTASAEPDYPKLELNNGELRALVYLPDPELGYYRGTRFDWSGLIERVDTAHHQYFTALHAAHSSLIHDCVCGPAEEFGMTEPMGFSEAAVGASFVKIGVGLLEKGDEDEYRFDGRYVLLQPGAWAIEPGPDKVEFVQDVAGERGWGYRYRKGVRLVPGQPEMVIERRLENTGLNTIDVDHYSHNFILIDGHPFGPDYRVEFGFEAEAPMRLDDRGWFRAGAVEIDAPLGTRSLWAPLVEGHHPPACNRACVRHLPSGALLSFQGDAPITRMVLWAVERAVCPEPFVRIHLAPGQARTWSTRYRFCVGNP